MKNYRKGPKRVRMECLKDQGLASVGVRVMQVKETDLNGGGLK